MVIDALLFRGLSRPAAPTSLIKTTRWQPSITIKPHPLCVSNPFIHAMVNLLPGLLAVDVVTSTLWSSLGCHSLSVTTRHNDEQSGWMCNHTLDSTSKYESLPTMVKPIVGVTLEAEPWGLRKNVFILPKFYLFSLH